MKFASFYYNLVRFLRSITIQISLQIVINLPKLYEEIKDQLPKPQSLIEAYKEIIPAVIKKSKDPSYYIPVKIPNV